MRDRLLVQYLSDQVWAILPSTLGSIREIVARHAAGVKLTREEIEARIGARQSPNTTGTKGVAVLPLWGVLVPHGGMMVDSSTMGTGLDEWLRGFQSAVADPNVSAIILDINSPGGSVEGVTETAAAVRAARAEKPVVAVANYLCASAAFAIASQADTFIASPSAMVGSVGVYTIHEDVSGALEREGVTPTIIQAPEDGFKTEGNPFGPLTDEALAAKQATVNEFYRMFVADVAKGRGIDASTVEASYGRGRLVTAAQAVSAGMIDGVAPLDQVVARMASGQPSVRGAKAEIEPEAVYGDFSGAVTWTFADTFTPDLVGNYAATFAGAQIAPQVSAAIAAAQASAPVAAVHNPNRKEDTAMEPVTNERPATISELAAQRDSLLAQMKDLNEAAAGRMFTADEQAEFDSLDERLTHTKNTIDQLNARDARLAGFATQTERIVRGDSALIDKPVQIAQPKRLPDNPFDVTAYRGFASSVDDLAVRLTEGARKVNDTLHYETKDDAKTKHLVDQLLSGSKGDAALADSFAHRILVTGSPEYDEAFGRAILNKPLSRRQEDTIRAAVSVTGLSTETPIPITIDPTVLLDSDGATNPMRRLARNVTITGNTWRGIATDGVAWTYDDELAAINPETPTFRGPEATVQRATCEVQFSIEVDQDWGGMRGEIARIVADAKNVKEADVFLNADPGSGGVEGLIFALNDDGGSVVLTDTPSAIALTDVEKVTDEMPPRFDNSSSWVANKAFYSKIRSLAGDEGRIDVWVPLAQGFASPGDGSLPYTLLGYGASAASEVSKAFTTPGENVAVLGDYQRGFVIIDRVGMNVELDPLVRDTNGKLVGARALFFYARNTSKVLSVNCFRMLQIADS